MNLYDEEELKVKKEKNKKMKKIVLIAIIFTIIVIVALMSVIFVLVDNPSKITFLVNGVESETLENELLVATSEEDDSVLIYMPIKGLANFWGYELYYGDSSSVYETEDVCYVNTENERIIFRLDSNVIYKRSLDTSNNLGENIPIQIENPIIKRDGELYIDRDGIEKAFNVSMSNLNKKTKKISITTLDAFVASAETLATNLHYVSLDPLFDNQKALLDNMMVVNAENGLKGVVVFSNEETRRSGTEILGTQYADIAYIPNKKVFIVKNRENNKVGVMADDVSNKTKISLRYDSLLLIDNEKDLFLAQVGNRFGVIDINENIIINFDYDTIGVDISSYSQRGLKNGYILLNKLIPVQREGKWGFYSIEKQADGSIKSDLLIGKLLFDGIGCITKTTGITTASAMIIEEYDLVIVEQGGYYGLMYTDGHSAIPATLTDIYVDTSRGQTRYYMKDRNENTIDMFEYFQKNNITKKE